MKFQFSANVPAGRQAKKKEAEQIFITPTAVIKQINLLENSLDVKLFERTHRGLLHSPHPSDTVERFLAAVQSAVQ